LNGCIINVNYLICLLIDTFTVLFTRYTETLKIIIYVFYEVCVNVWYLLAYSVTDCPNGYYLQIY